MRWPVCSGASRRSDRVPARRVVRVYADFCAQRARLQVGAFLERHLWRGPVAYVDLARVVRVLVRAGFNIHEVGDDTLSYAYTVRDWARALEAHAVRSRRASASRSQAYRDYGRDSCARVVASTIVAGRRHQSVPRGIVPPHVVWWCTAGESRRGRDGRHHTAWAASADIARPM